MRKWRVKTKEVHEANWEVFAETSDDAKKKVDAGYGEPVPNHDPFLHRSPMNEWNVELYAPISSQRLPNPPLSRIHPPWRE